MTAKLPDEQDLHADDAHDDACHKERKEVDGKRRNRYLRPNEEHVDDDP